MKYMIAYKFMFVDRKHITVRPKVFQLSLKCLSAIGLMINKRNINAFKMKNIKSMDGIRTAR